MLKLVRSAALTVLFASSPTLSLAGNYRVTLRDSTHDTYIATLGCTGRTVTISFDWSQRIGYAGKVRRHLFYGVNGDAHVMLPVLDDAGTVTGYAHDSERAKALIAEILRASEKDSVLVGVFPVGSDPVNGKWVDADFSFPEFFAAAQAVADRCHWDLISDLKHAHSLDTRPPMPPGYTGTLPEE